MENDKHLTQKYENKKVEWKKGRRKGGRKEIFQLPDDEKHKVSK